MLKKILLLSLFIIAYSSMNAQTFQWAKSIKSEGFDEGYDLAVDAFGNVYIAGQIEYDCDFGSGVILSSNGSHDIFLAKYTPSGDLVWARRAGGRLGDKAQSLSLDRFGHVFIVGELTDSSDFGPYLMFTQGINNTFVARYDTSGNVQWVRTFGTADTLNTRGYGSSCDKFGNIYVGGASQGDLYYNGNLMLTNTRWGNYDGFVAKFDSSGNFQWVNKIGGTDADKVNGVICDENDGVYATGYFSSRAYFTPMDSLRARGRTDLYLVKYDYNGNFKWVKQYGDTALEKGEDINFNSATNQVLITGQFTSRSSIGTNIINSQGLIDMFLAAFDTAGTPVFALSAGGVEDDIGRGVNADASGNIYVIGDFGGSATFPPFNVTGNGYSEAYIAKYDQTGQNLFYVRTIGSADNDRGRGIGTDPAGNVYGCGEYWNGLNLDGNIVPGDSLLDIFIAKLSQQAASCSTTISSGGVSCSNACDAIAVASSAGQQPFAYVWNGDQTLNTPSISNLCAGNYTVVATDALGCTSTASITITNPPAINITAISSNPGCIGCADGAIDITVSGGAPGYSYSWSNGSTSEDQTGLTQGDYSVCVSDNNTCVVCDTFHLTDPVSVNENIFTEAVSVYPNPMNDRGYVKIEGDIKNYEINIFSATGQLVVTGETENNRFIINRNNLSKGVYLISVTDKKSSKYKRLPFVVE